MVREERWRRVEGEKG
ncbi:hypothetical protein KIPB_015213, partial [Kipferlia bialata]|eukprot:g15213.t1